MTEHDIRVIAEYAEDRLVEHDGRLDDSVIRANAYSDWAIDELLGRLIEEESKPPEYVTGRPSISTVEVIEDFINEMEYYRDTSSTEEQILLYSIAVEEGENVLRIFEAERYMYD